MQEVIFRFHRRTKTNSFDKVIPREKWPSEWKEVQYKGYVRMPQILLPKPVVEESRDLVSLLRERRSKRFFSGLKIDEETISILLYYSFGLKSDSGERFYPSAGGRYPLETYLILSKEVKRRLLPGLYHYHVRAHSLEVLYTNESVVLKEMRDSINQSWAKEAPLFVVNTAIFSRTTDKYGVRGYRHVIAETGYTGQNIYLVSTMLGLSCCAIGGYKDDKINSLLDVDGEEESVVAVYVIG